MLWCIAGFGTHNNCDITWTLLCMEPKTFCQTSRDLINGIQLELNTYFTCGSNFDFYCRFQKYSKGRSHNIFRQTYIRYLQHPLQLLYVTPRFYGPSRCLQQPPSATSSPSPWSKAKGKSHPTWNTLIPTSLHIWKVKNHLWYANKHINPTNSNACHVMSLGFPINCFVSKDLPCIDIPL